MLNLDAYCNHFIPQSIVVFRNHAHIKEVLESSGYEVTYSGENSRYEYANTSCGYTVSLNGYCSNFKNAIQQATA